MQAFGNPQEAAACAKTAPTPDWCHPKRKAQSEQHPSRFHRNILNILQDGYCVCPSPKTKAASQPRCSSIIYMQPCRQCKKHERVLAILFAFQLVKDLDEIGVSQSTWLHKTQAYISTHATNAHDTELQCAHTAVVAERLTMQVPAEPPSSPTSSRHSLQLCRRQH
jgi:hypothetical protein